MVSFLESLANLYPHLAGHSKMRGMRSLVQFKECHFMGENVVLGLGSNELYCHTEDVCKDGPIMTLAKLNTLPKEY